ncbi:MAG: glycogen-binding domain-containing protein [Gemmatimonadota bacterium]
MNDRIHACLDGSLPRADLDEAERTALAAYERAIRTSLETLPDEPAPDMTAGVMDRIAEVRTPWEATADEAVEAPAEDAARAAHGKGDVASMVRWLWRPRQVTLRPGYAMAAAALLAVVLILPRGGDPASTVDAAFPVQQGGTVVSGSQVPGPVRVHFRLDAPEAGSVALAGDFTDWQPSLQLVENAPGVWTVVVPLDAGVHEYAFVVDGAWVTDPMAEQVDDGFGGVNSRVAVVERGVET